MQKIDLLPHNNSGNSLATLAVSLFEILLVLGFVGLFLVTLWLKTQSIELASQVTDKKAEKTTFKRSLERANQLESELQMIIDRDSELKRLQGSSAHLSKLFTEIAAATPPKVRLTGLRNKDGTEIAIDGVAAGRGDITTFTTSLEQVKQLANISLSQANIQSDGVTFALTANLVTSLSSVAPTLEENPSPGSEP